MIRLAADAELFVLGEEAVFFSSREQELHTFNTTASYVWCCLEEGMGPDEITSAYVGSFDVSAGDAARAVWGVLEAWEGLGYLSGLPYRAARSLDLTTALGRLLTRPDLREELREGPEELARRMGLKGEERDAFVALDPADVEAEADALDAWSRRLRGLATEPTAGVSLLSPTGTGRFLLNQSVGALARGTDSSRHLHYRLMGTRFCVRCPSAAWERVQAPFAHLSASPSDVVDRPLALLGGEGAYVLTDGSLPVGSCGSEGFAPLLRGTLQTLASQAREHFLQVHAAVIADRVSATLLPGPPGSGKTTLAAAAVTRGFRYLSEELALLEERTLNVVPMPLPLTVKSGSLGPLASLYPHLVHLPVHIREDHEEVRYLPPPDQAMAYDLGLSYPVRRVVFPSYKDGAETRLQPITRSEALGRLMQECLAIRKRLDATNVRHLVRWARQLDCYDLQMSDLAAAVGLLGTPA